MVLLRALQGIPADSVRRVVREVFARSEYQWAPGNRPLHWLRDLWHRFSDWIDGFNAIHPVAAWFMFWGSLFVLVGLLVHLGFTVWRIYRVTIRQPVPVIPGALAAPLDARAHLERADALARAGRFTEALAHRFAAMLLELDRAKALSFHPAKTPAEYVREARLSTEQRSALSGLVARLYQHVFGMAPCDEQCYRDFGIMAGSVVHHVVSN